MPEFISAVKGYLRLGNFPLDASTVFPSLAEAQQYAAINPTAYAGQLISVVVEEDKSVTAYQLSIPETGSGYVLELVAGGNVDTVNNIVPVEGNITITGADINAGIEGNSQTVATLIQLILTTFATKEYVDDKFDDSFIGVQRTIMAPVTSTGVFDPESVGDIPAGSVVKKVSIRIDEAYTEGTDISVSIGDTEILSSSDIFETDAGSTFYASPEIEISSDSAIVVSVSSGSSTGSAKLYVDFVRNTLS
jgi:hypothetical protein